jgi:hypothetical protein
MILNPEPVVDRVGQGSLSVELERGPMFQIMRGGKINAN